MPARRAYLHNLLIGTVVLASACSAPAFPASPPRAVRVTPVIVDDAAAARRYSGALLPRAQVELSFRVAGQVATITEVGAAGARRPLQEGDRVRRGDVLATLDPRDLRHQADAAAAALAIARAELAAAETAQAHAKTEVARARQLLAAEAIPRAEADAAEAAYDAVRGRVAAARSQRDARSEQAVAARRVLDDTRLISPIDGVIARRAVDVGETAAPGRGVFTIIDDRDVRVTFAVPDTRVGALRLGAELPVHLEALADRSFRGIVTKIEPAADPGSRTFAAELTVANPERALRPGMVATVALGGAAAPPTLRVPLASVLRVPGGDDLHVWVLAAGKATVTRRVVEVADLVGDDVVIAGGLAAGERVVVDGAALLHEGARVSVRP